VALLKRVGALGMLQPAIVGDCTLHGFLITPSCYSLFWISH